MTVQGTPLPDAPVNTLDKIPKKRKKESNKMVVLGMIIAAGFAFLCVATLLLLAQHQQDHDTIMSLQNQTMAQDKRINSIVNFLSSTQIPIDQVIIQNGTEGEKKILLQLFRR